MGKSRIAATVIYLLKSQKKFATVRYYFTHPALENLEKRVLDVLKAYLSGIEISTHCVDPNTCMIEANDQTLVILDEADAILVDQLVDVKAKFVVGLTATALTGNDNDNWEDYYVKPPLRVEVIDSNIATVLNSNSCYEDVDTVESYLKLSSEQAKLIYGDEKVKAELDRMKISY